MITKIEEFKNLNENRIYIETWYDNGKSQMLGTDGTSVLKDGVGDRAIDNAIRTKINTLKGLAGIKPFLKKNDVVLKVVDSKGKLLKSKTVNLNESVVNENSNIEDETDMTNVIYDTLMGNTRNAHTEIFDRKLTTDNWIGSNQFGFMYDDKTFDVTVNIDNSTFKTQVSKNSDIEYNKRLLWAVNLLLEVMPKNAPIYEKDYEKALDIKRELDGTK